MTEQPMVTFHLLIRGRVQQVSYRQSMRAQAIKRQINGWCRNLPDGQVEALIQGRYDNVQQLLEWCKHGPPHALVEHVQCTQLDEMIPLSCFEIRL
jgi:acylphosphatase